jgi:hypothetical protein
LGGGLGGDGESEKRDVGEELEELHSGRFSDWTLQNRASCPSEPDTDKALLTYMYFLIGLPCRLSIKI